MSLDDKATLTVSHAISHPDMICSFASASLTFVYDSFVAGDDIAEDQRFTASRSGQS
eukprot:COSAG02_NODE_6078_length_3816_cov_6.455172_4_plen_57_part_00